VNFLAHSLLAERAAADQQYDPDHPDTRMLIAGGFLGDFLKGPVPDTLPAALGQGVRLHRRIDAYSNTHSAIRRSSNRFPASLRRLAPALIDVIADHLLATQWSAHHHLTLDEFAHQTYEHIAASEAHLPERGQEFYRWMVGNDLLSSYLGWEATSRGMRSVTRRLRRQELDQEIASAVPPLLEALQEDFHEYFPDIQRHAVDWLSAERRSS